MNSSSLATFDHLRSSGQLHIWRYRLDISDSAAATLSKTFSVEDHHKCDRLVTRRLRRRAIASRGALRHLLGLYLDRNPSRIELETGPEGKPELVGEDEHRIAFNVSHTGDEGLLALTSDGILGVDLERIRPEIDVLRLARRVFSSSEQAQFSTIHEERLRPSFFHVWTCKEAFLKAHGGGLTVPLTSFDVEVDPDRGARLLDTRLPGDERGNWQLKTIDVEEGLRAAVAWSGSEPLRQISNFRLEDSPFPSRR